MGQKINITLAQINSVVGDLDYNRKVISDVYADNRDKTDLIVFPELAVCGYPPEDLVLKPAFLEAVEKALQDIIDLTNGSDTYLAVGAPLHSDGKTYNALHIIHDGQITATIKKHHLPNYGVFDEQRIFDPAKIEDMAPVTVKGCNIGFMICEDMWKPDVARTLKDKGAGILIVSNASPFEARKRQTRFEIAAERIEETGLPLLYVNQVGGQDELVFDGASFALNEDGVYITQSEEFSEDILHTLWEKPGGAEHWLSDVKNIPQDKIHDQAPGRQNAPDYESLSLVYDALITGLRDYVGKNGFRGVIIGLSGGIDSALSAAIAVDALGSAAVRGVTMPSRYTADESLEDATNLAENLGIQMDTISITDHVAAFESTLQPFVTKNTPGTAFENIQSRSRGVILMALSNMTGHMVLSTGNKSEMAVGYATLYGDMAGGFNVLKDIYKTQVYELARWRNENKPSQGLGPDGLVIPVRTITKPPSAELKPDQTDQDTLPPYEALDDILFCLIEKDMGLEDIVERGHDAALVKKVWTMLDRAEYKRRQAPPGVKITSRAFGRDRRYPITHHYMPDRITGD